MADHLYGRSLHRHSKSFAPVKVTLAFTLFPPIRHVRLVVRANDIFSHSPPNVCPFTFGMDAGGIFTKLIPRCPVIPTMKAQIFDDLRRPYVAEFRDLTFACTDTFIEPTVLIRIIKGERALTEANHFLGKFELKNILSAPRGVPYI
jgi:molecular chaperone DnaK (HSP70)